MTLEVVAARRSILDGTRVAGQRESARRGAALRDAVHPARRRRCRWPRRRGVRRRAADPSARLGRRGTARRALARPGRMASDRRGRAGRLGLEAGGGAGGRVSCAGRCLASADGIEVAGPGAARLLAAGVPLDLDLSGFPVGMATRTLLLKAEITLWRREAERFWLDVGRSFAPYVAAALTQSAADQEAG